MLSNCHLIIFTRFPQPGKSKTRLISALGPEGAAALQQKMTEKIGAEALALKKQRGIPVTCFFSGGSRESMAAWLGDSFDYKQQCGGNIGRRMSDAFTRTFQYTSEAIILVGSDIPELTAKILGDAFITLQNSDAVFGPSRDGGYYLLGLNGKNQQQLIKTVFERIPWSTSKVLTTSINRLMDSGYSCSLLKTLQDIDRPEDLHVARRMQLL